MEHCTVGMFKLPGLKFDRGLIPAELQEQMLAWAKENHCGMQMNEWLWSFKSEEKRDWFILRWSDEINKIESEREKNA